MKTAKKLSKTFERLLVTFTPAPPLLNLTVDKKAKTYSVNLRSLNVRVPKYWKEMKSNKQLLGHEIKHASIDGLPYTWKHALRYEATTMSWTALPANQTRNILNAVYDVIVDSKVQESGLNAKEMCEEWVKRFPITPDNEGTTYHLLQIIYKDLFSIDLPETAYEKKIRTSRDYKVLLRLLKQLVKQHEREVTDVARAAQIMARLSHVTDMPNKDVGFNRGDKEAKQEAIEAGLDAGLTKGQLSDFVGESPEKLDELIEETADERVREALWEHILAFDDLFSGVSYLTIKEPGWRRWRPYSKKIDPASIVRYPHNPRKWREIITVKTLTVKQKGDSGGFSKVILLIDYSGSTEVPFKNKTVLSYIKSAAYGLVAYARQFSLPLVTIVFATNAKVLAKEKDSYLTHAKRVFKLTPTGSTNLYRAVNMAQKIKPEQSLIMVITDGLVNQQDISLLLEQTKANKVAIAIVDSSEEGVKTVQVAQEKAQLFVVRPDATGKVLVQVLDKNITARGD